MNNKYTIKDKVSKIIKNNIYLKKYISNKIQDTNSLSYLIKNKSLSQSDCIKVGFAMEKVLRDLILDFNKDLVCIKPKNVKDIKEKDHLFLNETTKEVIYSELKANLNLDTEKSKSTAKKCLNIVEELTKEYPDYTIKWCLLGLRYYTRHEMSKGILKKHSKVKANLLGVNEYFHLLDIPLVYSKQEYIDFINEIVDTMIELP